MLLRCSMAALAICTASLALAAMPASATVRLVNPGFETGSTAGWQGNGAAARSYEGYTAPDGSYFGLVRSPGCPGETLEQHFTAGAGDVLTGWAFFRTNDELPYDDGGAIRLTVEQSGTDTVVFSSSVSQVGNGGGTPWTRFVHKIESPGSYVLQVRVENGVDCSTASAVGIDLAQSEADDDGDVVSDEIDNCPGLANGDQLDHDGDEQGDACDADDDNDGFDDPTDNCPSTANGAQADTDGDATGDACDADDDNDTVDDGADNCDLVANTDQPDNDADRHGDACDADDDNDTVDDGLDNCPTVANGDQGDDDRDGVGDRCDEGFDSSFGRATGGGWVRSDGEKVSFSVSAKSTAGSRDGTCTVTVRHTKIKCLSLDGYAHDPANGEVVLVGEATLDGAPTHYRIEVRDGADDRFAITTASGFSAGGIIDGGNIRIHQG